SGAADGLALIEQPRKPAAAEKRRCGRRRRRCGSDACKARGGRVDDPLRPAPVHFVDRERSLVLAVGEEAERAVDAAETVGIGDGGGGEAGRSEIRGEARGEDRRIVAERGGGERGRAEGRRIARRESAE